MSQEIEFKRVAGIRLKFEGQEYSLRVPSLEKLLPILNEADKELSFTDSIAKQREVFDLCGLPDNVYLELNPAEHAAMWDIILGQLKKK